MNTIKKALKTLQWGVILAATVFATIILVRAFDARRLGEVGCIGGAKMMI